MYNHNPNFLNTSNENYVSYEFVFGDGPFFMKVTLISVGMFFILPAISVICSRKNRLIMR